LFISVSKSFIIAHCECLFLAFGVNVRLGCKRTL
jgi:hypothetical protein